MKKKKTLAMLLAVAAIATAAVQPVAAASVDQGSAETFGTEWTFELKNDPTYTVTIPSAVTLSRDGTQVDVIAENVANLDGQRISVTIAGTDAYRNQMMLSGVNENGIRQSLRYSITTASGERIETFGNGKDILGKELASFTKDGTVSFTVAPVITAVEENSSSYKGVTYTGSMTYGIALVGE